MQLRSVIKIAEPRTLAAGLIPVLYGSVYAMYKYGTFNIWYTAGLAVAMALIQSSTNMFNDYMDYHKGADLKSETGEKPLMTGELKAWQVPVLILLYLTIALGIGIAIASQTSWYILLVGVIGVWIACFYSFGPLPISYTPFGELAAGVTMGAGITATVVYIQSGIWDKYDLLMTIPTVIYIGYILYTNNLCDREKDLIAGRHTLPGLLGYSRAKTGWMLCNLLITGAGLCLILLGIYPLWSLMIVGVMLMYRKLWRIWKLEQQDFQKGKMMGMVGKIGMYYHVLAMISLLLAYWLD